MGTTTDFLRAVRERIVRRYGERLVSSLADTSSDAPNNFAAPKRDLYDKLKAEGQLDPEKKDR